MFGSNLSLHHLHYTGILDVDMSYFYGNQCDDAVRLIQCSPFVKQKLPAVKNVLTEWSVQNQGYTWNDRIQSSIESVLGSQNLIYGNVDGEPSQTSSNLLEHYFQYFAVQGKFYAAARSGAEVIVNEYSLPTHMQTADLVSLNDRSTEDGGYSADAADEEVFMLDGLVYRLVAVPANSKDLDVNSSDVYFRNVSATDSIKHKIAGNDFKAFSAVQKAVFSLFTSEDNSGQVIRPCTVAQTIVDYGGFRVQVFCPLYLEENKTLKYGQSSLEDIFICRDIPDPASGDEYLYAKLFMQLAEKLNLRQRIIRTVVSDQPGMDNLDNARVYESTEMVLTKDIQLHQSDDDRFYLVNFRNLLPPDLPDTDSNDVLTKHFRPEFVAKFSLALSPEALSIDNSPTDTTDTAENADLEVENEVRHVFLVLVCFLSCCLKFELLTIGRNP